ncbi:TIGR03943 family protein [Streptomyces sp. ISL-12]|uniref:TIGR03943 family putative permease subunit n=1 Tax=Streptomyces sp. ISL-12 TaxID=2819177 RepID=UPI001BE91804|nr:TIGR03943 family protein [Streptomyces sp. ISL-12]MBT2412392.1 TIGR03943 family protein [Streptomyces sp. ISL-12]
MRRYGPAVLLALTGAAVLRISLFSELYLRYVQEGLRPCLILSGAVLVLLAAVSVCARRPRQEAPDDGHGHGHDDDGHGHDDDGHGHSHGAAGPRVAWLLTLPALALLLFPPPALGTYSAEREAAQRAAQGVGTFPALPSGDPVELTLAEFSSRAIYDSGRSLKGRTVRLTGFVTRDDDGTWYVTRLLVTCCAADATTSKVEVRGDAAADAPDDGAWVTVTGTWHPEGTLGSEEAWPPVVDAEQVRRVAQPANPYERP